MLTLTQFLGDKYGLSNVRLTPAPRGFVAETYYVDSDSGRYFAKLVKAGNESTNIQRTLPVLQELRTLGIEQITYPIPTRPGDLSTKVDGSLLILFNYIEGRWVFDFPLPPYVRLLAQIHQVSDQIQTPLARETFDLPFEADLWMYLERMWSGSFAHPQEGAMQAWAITRRAEIERDFALLKQAVKELRSRDIPYVLTHSDAAGNILYDGQQVYLVDWDDVMFAPRERDTWFHRRTDGFLALYRQYVPGYEYDPTLYRFYLYKRYMEDAVGFFDKVLSPDSTDEQKVANLHEHYKTCDDWLRPLMDMERAGE